MSSNRLPPKDEPSDEPMDSSGLGNCLRETSGGLGGYTPPPDEPRKRSFCWACSSEILNRADGTNLIDVENVREFHVHHRCWEPLADVDKMRITIMARQMATQEFIGVDRKRVASEIRAAIRERMGKELN